VTPDEHRRLGVELYNGTWELIERQDRTPDEDDEMLDRAHASAYHWLHAAGATVANRARSQWLCSRVHAVAGQPEGAIHHARRCLALVEEHGDEMEDWDLAAAHEALARAHLAAGDVDEARSHFERARAETATIANPHDAEHIEADLDALPL
jgi:tetratricopeptide (TPR) repeat protein